MTQEAGNKENGNFSDLVLRNASFIRTVAGFPGRDAIAFNFLSENGCNFVFLATRDTVLRECLNILVVRTRRCKI